MKLAEYLQLDATALSELVKKREVTPIELISLSFEQLNQVNPKLNAVINELQEVALKEAKIIKDGSFSGVPMLMKNISQKIAGTKITSGAYLMKNYKTMQDSNFVKKVREAGFIFTGYTNTPEFALKNITEPKLYGATRNPWNEDFSPGGSSGGAAAAVASGIVPMAGASDGGGSIRIPASFTSLVGLKPTRGRTPVGPGVGRQWHGASIDFMLSRSVRDSAAMLDQLQVIQEDAAFQVPKYQGKYSEAIQQDLSKLKIGYTMKSPVNTPVSKDAIQAVNKLIHYLESIGHDVEEAEPEIDGIQIMRNYYLMNSGEMASGINSIEQALGRPITYKDVELETWMLNEAGKAVSAIDFTNSLASWDTAAAQMTAYHQKYDLFITPATASSAPKVGELTPTEDRVQYYVEHMSKANDSDKQELIWEMFLPSLTYTPFTQLANLTGQPGISLPIYLTEENLPIGVQVMARKGQEDLLLNLAHKIEQSDLWIGMTHNPYF